MFKKIFYTIVILLFIFIAVGLVLPRTVHVERSVEIDRPSVLVFSLVNSYQTFTRWSPWAARDPAATYQYSGPDEGVGARISWQGDPRLSGSGSQEIISSKPYSEVQSRLKFEQQGEATTRFVIRPRNEGGVTVTWSFDADLTAGQSWLGGLMARYFGLLFDRWIGTDFERGLANLKTLAESMPDADFSDLEAEVVEVPPIEILYVSSVSRQQSDDIAATLAAAYQEILAFMRLNGIAIAGQPLVIFRSGDEDGYAFDAAMPAELPEGGLSDAATVGEEVGEESGEVAGEVAGEPHAAARTWQVRAGTTPTGPAVRAIHRGAYDQMSTTYAKLKAFMDANGLEADGVSWEQYVSDPSHTPEDEFVTHIYFMTERSD